MKALLSTFLLVTFAPAAFGAGICLVDSPQGPNGTVDCDPIAPTLFPNAVVGFSADGAPCETGSCFGPELYGWSISASDMNPFVNSGPIPLNVPVTLYLWLACDIAGGAAAAQFSFETDGDPSFFLAGFQTLNGVLNAGTMVDPLLAIPGCPSSPFLAGALTVIHFGTVSSDAPTWGGIKALYR